MRISDWSSDVCSSDLLRHKRLTKAHNFRVGAAARVEIRSPLAAADRQPGQGVLEGLLEAEELDDPDVDRRMEAQAPLVRPERRVELDAKPPVDAEAALVVDPRQDRKSTRLNSSH